MATGFDAGAAVDALAYDFTTLKRPDGTPYEGQGVTPEPSNAQLTAFLRRVRELSASAGFDPARAVGASPQELAAQLGDIDESALEQVLDQMIVAFAEFCQGHPTEEQIRALPYRVRQAWMAWLLRELTDPTRLNAASTPLPAARANGASST